MASNGLSIMSSKFAQLIIGVEAMACSNAMLLRRYSRAGKAGAVPITRVLLELLRLAIGLFIVLLLSVIDWTLTIWPRRLTARSLSQKADGSLLCVPSHKRPLYADVYAASTGPMDFAFSRRTSQVCCHSLSNGLVGQCSTLTFLMLWKQGLTDPRTLCGRGCFVMVGTSLPFQLQPFLPVLWIILSEYLLLRFVTHAMSSQRHHATLCDLQRS